MSPTRSFASVRPAGKHGVRDPAAHTTPATPTVTVSVPSVRPARAADQPYVRIRCVGSQAAVAKFTIANSA
jgi:hypothetical protein